MFAKVCGGCAPRNPVFKSNEMSVLTIQQIMGTTVETNCSVK